MAQDLAEFCKPHNIPIPTDVDEVLNPSNLDAKLINLLQQKYRKENSIPVYDKDTSHFSDKLLDPDDPDSFLTIFGKMKILRKLYKKQINILIKKSKKEKKKKQN